MEVHGRGVWHRRGCIDCVRLVRREEIRRDRKRGPRSEMQMRIKEKRETLVVEMYVSGQGMKRIHVPEQRK